MGNFDYKKWVTENKYGKLNEAVNYPNMLKMFGVEEALKMMVTKMRDAIKSGKVKDSELGTIEDMGDAVGKMFVKAAEDAIEANK